MKTILLPTDLTVHSLFPIHQLAASHQGQNCKIMVVHMLYLPTSITDLLFIGRTTNLKRVPAVFDEALQSLCNKYKPLGIHIQFQFVHCQTASYLRNFIEGNNIEEVCLLDSYQYESTLPDSANINSFIKRCRIPLRQVPVKPEVLSGFGSLSVLLHGNQANVAEREAEPALSYN